MEYFTFGAEQEDVGTRIDVFLADAMENLSRSGVQKLIEEGHITLNGGRTKANYKLRERDIIDVEVPEVKEVEILPEDIPLDILYEDAYMIALDKPAGQLVHPSPRKNEGTLANALLGYYERTDQPCGIRPVTRLDRDTFGVVLLAKNAHIHAKLCQLMKDGAIHKTYLASVFGCPEQPAGEIALPVYKLGNGSLLRMVDPRGKRAVSRYRVISSDHQTSILALNPVTGRTHQLRLHCKAAGFPILGDPQYCSPASALYSGTHGLFCQQLLAARLELTHPVTGQPLVISSRQSVSAGDEQVHADARVLDGNVRAV